MGVATRKGGSLYEAHHFVFGGSGAYMAALLVASALPAFADKGGIDHAGACGLGKFAAHRAIANPVAPGASETTRIPPARTGCTGNP